MATLTLKDIPDDLHAAFRLRAEMHGRSLNKEIIAALKKLAFPQPFDVASYLERARAFRKSVDFEVCLDEVLSAVEEGR